MKEKPTDQRIEVFRICWKHKDFSKSSCGPVLRHSDRGRTKNGVLYTRQEALKTCQRFNLHKSPVRHWVEDVVRRVKL